MGKKYIGINGGTTFNGFNYNGWHDANVSIIDENGDLVFYAASERFGNRLKEDSSLETLSFIPEISADKEDIICAVCMAPNDEKIEGQNPSLAMKFKQYDNNFYCDLEKLSIMPQIALNHHFCHILSSWCFRKNDDMRFAIAYDGAGTTAFGTIETCLGGFIDKNGFLMVPIENIPSSAFVGGLINEPNSAGKLMGLSGYHKIQDKDTINFSNKDLITLIEAYQGPLFHGMVPWSTISVLPHIVNEDQEKLKLMARLYKMWTNFIWEAIEKNINKYIENKNLGIVIGGGTCLALELNSNAHKKVKDLVFGPAINDSGLSLGAAAFGYFMDTGKWPNPIKTPSIMYLPEPLPKIGPQDPKEIAKLVANDSVIGLLRGKAECGPRALGFRSILANACKYKNLKRVSEDLKGREYFRPLAPIVTAESFDRYFIGPQGEYMQYKCECKSETQKELPAIVHKDNSSRPQVVFKENDPWLHSLLVEYGRLTGHECMINTSLNGKGKPICNTYQDAVDDFQGKDIELISIQFSQ